jgi:TMEM175 potassium channel family protein
MAPVAELRRERDFERFLTFVDAVVAIAITLLVLPLVDFAGEIEEGQSAADLIGDHAGAVGATVLSFLVIARLWLAQHDTLSDVVAQDRALTQLMLLWLLLIVLLPFPTALLGDAGDEALTKILYMGTIAASCFCLAAVGRHVGRPSAVRGSGVAR